MQNQQRDSNREELEKLQGRMTTQSRKTDMLGIFDSVTWNNSGMYPAEVRAPLPTDPQLLLADWPFAVTKKRQSCRSFISYFNFGLHEESCRQHMRKWCRTGTEWQNWKARNSFGLCIGPHTGPRFCCARTMTLLCQKRNDTEHSGSRHGSSSHDSIKYSAKWIYEPQDQPGQRRCDPENLEAMQWLLGRECVILLVYDWNVK